MTEPICLFCKSFRDDLDRFARLLDSVEAHNVERLPFCVSVPEADRDLFLQRCGSGRFELFTDEQIRGRPELSGWRDQQVVKLSFWKQHRADATLVVDSDFQFLRDFGRADLVDGDGSAFLIASTHSHCWEDGAGEVRAALRGEAPLPRMTPAQIEAYAADTRVPPPPSLLARLRRFRVEGDHEAWFGRPGRPLWFMQGPILTHGSQETFYREFLLPRGLTYGRLVRGYSFEYKWLGEWRLARHRDELRPVPPTFLHFRSDAGIVEARSQGVTRADVARSYLGVSLAARHQEIMEF